MSFTFFEVTNWVEVATGSAKPRLVERGPYVFDEKKRKEILNVSKDHLTYRQYKSFQFNENSSVGSLEDVITIVNVPAIVSLNHLIINARDKHLYEEFYSLVSSSSN